MKSIWLTLCLACCTWASLAQTIRKVEPAFWWTNMANPSLQILVHGDDLNAYQFDLIYPGVRIDSIVRLENPNYAFLYLHIAPEARPGIMRIDLIKKRKKHSIDYELKAREERSSERKGFDASDLLYLIMPDRFANGNPQNDQPKGILEKTKRQDPFGRHGGDLAGIRKHLDYINDLGVTAVWLNPVLENNMPEASYHGYACTDYYKIDPRFGSNDDYKAFINDCHQRGLKVVMDMIFNHCGSYHWWMNDLPDRQWINNDGSYTPCNHRLFTIMDPYADSVQRKNMHTAWFVPEMPDLNQKHPQLATYLIQNSIWWIEWAGIDGIRQDTHPYADITFMSQWCRAIRAEYPHFTIVGETWYATPGSTAWWQENSRLNPHNTYLKSVMDFPLMFAINKALSEETHWDTGLYELYLTLSQDFLYPDPQNLLIFADNHDLSRFTKVGEPNLNRYKQMLSFLMTTRGIPQIYYGTELLMTGEKKDGDGALRNDMLGGWAEDPRSAFMASGRTPEQNQAIDLFKRIAHWRKNNTSLHHGSLVQFAPIDGIYVYFRQSASSCVMVILNGRNQDQTLDLKPFEHIISPYLNAYFVWEDLNTQRPTQIHIAAKESIIIELKNQ